MQAGETVTAYVPNRLMRRQLAGKPCGFCMNLLHMKDLWALQDSRGITVDYLHEGCLENLLNPPTQPAESGRKKRQARKSKGKESLPDEKD